LGVQPGLLASDDQSVHHERMSEDEIGEIRDELKAYKQKLDELREDFKFFLMHEFEATNRIIEKANQRGNPGYSQFSRKQAKAIRLSLQSVSRRFTDSA
jgi:hypothetical protein